MFLYSSDEEFTLPQTARVIQTTKMVIVMRKLAIRVNKYGNWQISHSHGFVLCSCPLDFLTSTIVERKTYRYFPHLFFLFCFCLLVFVCNHFSLAVYVTVYILVQELKWRVKLETRCSKSERISLLLNLYPVDSPWRICGDSFLWNSNHICIVPKLLLHIININVDK